ncbi:MAG: uroporphyrinogen decarboxylase family protein [bacterium]|nr:uroporphyrinogen decarboxylase family protein [bacterium]
MSQEKMSSQERVKTAISRKIPDRVPIHDSPWGATIKKWHEQGLPERKSPRKYFGYDIVNISANLTPRLTTKIIEENEEYIVETTSTGGIRRNHRDYSTTPEIIECPVKKKNDWPFIKERLKPDFKRIDWASAWGYYQKAREDGLYIVFGAASGYDLLQSYIKSEELLIFMATDPEWIKEMVDTTSDLILETVKMMYKEGFRFDGVWVYNDMGYRNSSLFSPSMYERIIAPSDKKRNDWFHEHKMQTILHSCGCVKGLIPSLIKHGFDCLQPLEVKAGMDLRELKPEYGDKIALFGGINVMLMEDPDDSKIEKEIQEKFEIAKKGGGYLFHSDHSIPLDVSFRKYQFVMDCVKKYGRY